jgi:Fe-S-cluster containining protein
MTEVPTQQSASATATIDLKLDGQPLRMRLTVPAGAATPGQLLHLLRGLTDAVVDAAMEKSAAQGREISCRKGCGACCRQLVPIAPAEAHRLREVVDAMPEPRRSEVQARFETAHARLTATGMLDRLRAPARTDEASRRRLGIDYFRHGVACPFLEQESCSIYTERPLACREYLVTSPAEHCAQPTPDNIDCLPIAARVSRALCKLEAYQDDDGLAWVPLITAMEWAQLHPEVPPNRSGPMLLESLFKWLGAKQSATGAGA